MLGRIARRRLEREWQQLSPTSSSSGENDDDDDDEIRVALAAVRRSEAEEATAGDSSPSGEENAFLALTRQFAAAQWHVRAKITRESGTAEVDLEVLIPPNFPSRPPLVHCGGFAAAGSGAISAGAGSGSRTRRLPAHAFAGNAILTCGGFVLLSDARHREDGWTPVSTLREVLTDAARTLGRAARAAGWVNFVGDGEGLEDRHGERDDFSDVPHFNASAIAAPYSANELWAGATRMALPRFLADVPSNFGPVKLLSPAGTMARHALRESSGGSQHEEDAFTKRLERGSRLVLPASVLDALTSTPNLGFPLCFELSVASSGIRAFASPIEFSAPEGIILMPRWLQASLGITRPRPATLDAGGGVTLVDSGEVAGDGEGHESSVISLRHVVLPTATMLQFQPLSQDFVRKNGNDRDAVIGLLEAELPHFSVLCVGDTIPVRQGGDVHWLNVTQVKPSEFGAAMVIGASGFLEVAIDFLPSLDAGEGDLSMSGSQEVGDLRASLGVPIPGGGDAPGQTAGEVEDIEGTSLCSNCGRRVPAASLVMHSAVCATRNIRCGKCDALIDRNGRDKHEAEVHAVIPCPRSCGASFEICERAAHLFDDCARRRSACSLGCGFATEFRFLPGHESECATKTVLCESCNYYIARSEMAAGHRLACQVDDEAIEINCPLCQFPMLPGDLASHATVPILLTAGMAVISLPHARAASSKQWALPRRCHTRT